MSVTLIGGMDRLKQEYVGVARKGGHDLKCISRNEHNFADRLGNPDAIIVFTNRVSHEARRKAQEHARCRDIPLRFLHSCGLSSLRQCLDSFADA
ncbi:MAG: DUF2325 domain-containing protein [Desulfovibrio sp.]|jgi:hypothetical protein|nr:DUF2325 domain-containing protein [Desulfovibrio sp.]